MTVEIDSGSGFCFGVTRAIRKAEEELTRSPLHCLGDIVHNGRECDRLHSLGLNTIGHDEFARLPQGERVLLRAHGEPPATYALAEAHGLQIIDATCPVVLHLQERIKREYDLHDLEGKQIVIFGKKGHAEVLGLVGQTEGTAIVIETPEEAARLDMSRPIALFSQTTKSIDGFRSIVDYINTHIEEGVEFRWSDTICRQVGGRMQALRQFAAGHDVVLFVCGKKSSNGRVLYNQCREQNPRTYMVDDATEIEPQWFVNCSTVGVCGATSTPGWLMQECKEYIEHLMTPEENYYPDELYGERLLISTAADKTELSSNIRAARAILSSFPDVVMHINAHRIIFGRKNPEYLICDKVGDRKGIMGERGVTAGFKSAKRQGCKIVVLDLDEHILQVRPFELSRYISRRKADFVQGLITDCYVAFSGRAVRVNAKHQTRVEIQHTIEQLKP